MLTPRNCLIGLQTYMAGFYHCAVEEEGAEVSLLGSLQGGCRIPNGKQLTTVSADQLLLKSPTWRREKAIRLFGDEIPEEKGETGGWFNS